MPGSARDAVIPHLSSPTFDASTFEVWGPLLHGGRLRARTADRVPTPAVWRRRSGSDGLDDDVADGRRCSTRRGRGAGVARGLRSAL